MPKKYYFVDTQYCVTCKQGWILISDQPISEIKYNFWIASVLMEHNKIMAEEGNEHNVT